jgi:hypothetical protein
MFLGHFARMFLKGAEMAVRKIHKAKTSDGTRCHACPGEFHLSTGAGLDMGRTISAVGGAVGIIWLGWKIAFALAFILAGLTFILETAMYRYR